MISSLHPFLRDPRYLDAIQPFTYNPNGVKGVFLWFFTDFPTITMAKPRAIHFYDWLPVFEGFQKKEFF